MGQGTEQRYQIRHRTFPAKSVLAHKTAGKDLGVKRRARPRKACGALATDQEAMPSEESSEQLPVWDGKGTHTTGPGHTVGGHCSCRAGSAHTNTMVNRPGTGNNQGICLLPAQTTSGDAPQS